MVIIENIQEKELYDKNIEGIIKMVIETSLKKEGFLNNYEINVFLVDNKGIKDFNRKYRNIDRDTDVLSFPMIDYGETYYSKEFKFSEFDILPNGIIVLGDIVLSLEKAREQSIEYNHSFEREIAFLVCHSSMHLLGHDHEKENERRVMREKEEAILEELSYIR